MAYALVYVTFSFAISEPNVSWTIQSYKPDLPMPSSTGFRLSLSHIFSSVR